MSILSASSRFARVAHGRRMTQARLFPEPVALRKINRFRGRWGFLHNFFIEPDGSLVEREYQAAKCRNLADVRRFKDLNGHASKDLGRSIEVREDWMKIREEVMLEFTLQKYKDHPSLRALLLSTEDWYLEEENRHGDEFWGTVGGRGLNKHGLILMRVRSLL